MRITLVVVQKKLEKLAGIYGTIMDYNVSKFHFESYTNILNSHVLNNYGY